MYYQRYQSTYQNWCRESMIAGKHEHYDFTFKPKCLSLKIWWYRSKVAFKKLLYNRSGKDDREAHPPEYYDLHPPQNI